MKEEELRKHAKCSKCKKLIGHTKIPMFWVVKVKRYGLDLAAISRQQGLAMMLGGNGALAQVMGTNEDMAKDIVDVELTLCEDCALSIMELLDECGKW